MFCIVADLTEIVWQIGAKQKHFCPSPPAGNLISPTRNLGARSIHTALLCDLTNANLTVQTPPPVPARHPSDSVTSQAGPFASLSNLDSGLDGKGADAPTSPMAHNVDPMKVIVDPPDTARLLEGKESAESRTADADTAVANPLAATIPEASFPGEVRSRVVPPPPPLSRPWFRQLASQTGRL